MDEKPQRVISVDTETTGLDPYDDEVLQVGVVDALTGDTLLDTYARPEKADEWPEAMAVNGITPEMVADAPSQAFVAGEVQALVDGSDLVIAYNAPFDRPFLETMGVDFSHARVADMMEPFAHAYGEWDEDYQDWRWQRLSKAAAHVGYDWGQERAHGAVADARACAAVWRWLKERPSRRRKTHEYSLTVCDVTPREAQRLEDDLRDLSDRSDTPGLLCAVSPLAIGQDGRWERAELWIRMQVPGVYGEAEEEW